MLAFHLLAASSAYLLPSHLHVCTPARQHPLRTAPLRMNSEWSASDEVLHAAARTPQRSLASAHAACHTAHDHLVRSDAGIASQRDRARLDDQAGFAAQRAPGLGFGIRAHLQRGLYLMVVIFLQQILF